jgi:hypothetical protein
MDSGDNDQDFPGVGVDHYGMVLLSGSALINGWCESPKVNPLQVIR